jgi:hypothetical protein
MRMLAAAGVLLAALLVLVAAGGSRPPQTAAQPMQPVDPGEVVPSDLSRQAMVNWGMANHAVEQAAYEAANCGRRSDCQAGVRATFDERRSSVLADARMMSAAPGSCGQAFAYYAAGMQRYRSPTGHARARAMLERATQLIWHDCQRAR